MPTLTVEDLQFEVTPRSDSKFTITSKNKAHKPLKSRYTIPGILGFTINITEAQYGFQMQTLFIQNWATYSSDILSRSWTLMSNAVNGKSTYGAYMKDPNSRNQYFMLRTLDPMNQGHAMYHPEYIHTTGCKESATNNLCQTNTRTAPEIFIAETFDKGALEWLESIQKNIPAQDRFKIDGRKHFLRLKFPEWWFADNQGYYRIGWALLAARAANKRQPITPGLLQKHFDDFVAGKFSLKNPQPNKWCGTYNWQWHSGDNFKAENWQ